jgi:hypothetical protein
MFVEVFLSCLLAPANLAGMLHVGLVAHVQPQHLCHKNRSRLVARYVPQLHLNQMMASSSHPSWLHVCGTGTGRQSAWVMMCSICWYFSLATTHLRQSYLDGECCLFFLQQQSTSPSFHPMIPRDGMCLVL